MPCLLTSTNRPVTKQVPLSQRRTGQLAGRRGNRLSSSLLFAATFLMIVIGAGRATALEEFPIANGVAPGNSDTTNPGRSAVGFDGTNYLVVSCREIGSPPGIFGVILSNTGVVLKTFPISEHRTFGLQHCSSGFANPSVAFDGTNYFVVFHRRGTIVGTRISLSGDVLDGPDGFAISTGTSNSRPAVAFDGGNYLAVWENFDSTSKIFGARITPAGEVLDQFPISTALEGQGDASVAFGGGSYLVVWTDGRGGIFGTRVTPGGEVLDAEGIPISIAPREQSSARVIFDGTNYFVVWLDRRDDPGGLLVRLAVFGTRVKLDGTLLDGPPDTGGIAISELTGGALALAFDGTNYLVAYSVGSFPIFPPAGIFVSRVSATGDVVDTAGLLISEPPCRACRLVHPSIVFNGETSLIAWVNNNEGAPKDIVAVLIGFPDEEIEAAAFFPLLPGTTWTYLENGSTTLTASVLDKPTVLEGVETTVVQFSNKTKSSFTSDANGIQLHATSDSGGTVVFVPPILLAEAVTAVRRSVNSNGEARLKRMAVPYSSTFTIDARGSVTVPAGTFDVVRLRGTITISGSPILFTFFLAEGIGIVKERATGPDGIERTLELVATNANVHDFAVTRIIAPRRATLTAGIPARTALAKVLIQNRSGHSETIPDLATLGNLVTLTVESLGACAAPAPVLLPPARRFPLTLRPKQTLTLGFNVTIGCANDPAASTPGDPAHWDYRYMARVNHSVLDGTGDTHVEDDVCPRPALGFDPNPDGTIRDPGCGDRNPDRTLGADILTDVVTR